jgi:hypothetical protein
MYQVTIKWADGNVTRALVNKQTLRGFRLTACRGASIKIEKVRS